MLLDVFDLALPGVTITISLSTLLGVIFWILRNRKEIKKILAESKSNITVKLYSEYKKMYSKWKKIFNREFDIAFNNIISKEDYNDLMHKFINEAVEVVKKYKVKVKRELKSEVSKDVRKA